MTIIITHAPNEVKNWLNRAEKETGLSKSAIIAAAIMENRSRSNEGKATTKKPA